MLKKLVAMSLSLAIILPTTQGFAATVKKPASVTAKAIKYGIVPKRLQGNYNKSITRDEFAELMVQTMFKSSERETGEISWTKDQLLKQVTIDTPVKDTSNDYVKVAFILGLVDFKYNKFNPTRVVTRQEAAQMIMSAYHLDNYFSYDKKVNKVYKDYKYISPTYLPAVTAINSSHVLMKYTKGKFEPKKALTRLQAIDTAYTLYTKETYSRFSLRGNIPTNQYLSEKFFNVGNDYVKANYKQVEEYSETVYNLENCWYAYGEVNGKEFNVQQAVILYGYNQVLENRDYKYIWNPTLENKSVTLNYGYMTVTTFTEDSDLTFKFKNIKGFSTVAGQNKYGFPQKAVKPVIVK